MIERQNKSLRMPTTELESFLSYEKEENELELKWVKREISNDTYEEKSSNLFHKYNVSINDRYTFNTEDELLNFLKSWNCFYSDDIKKSIAHERDHYREAIKQGLNAKYGIWMLKNKDIICCVPLCFTEGNITTEISASIASAPKEASALDKLNIERIVEMGE